MARTGLYRIAAATLAAAALGGSFAGAGEAFDLSKKVWFEGRTVDVFVMIPSAAGGSGPDGPSPRHPDVDVYLVGAISETEPYGPQARRPAIDPATGTPLLDEHGRPRAQIVIPAHDDVFSQFAAAAEPADTFGHWVVPGPRASDATVRTRSMPADSLAGAPLVWSIRLDGEWRPLIDAAVIEEGIARGLLKLAFSNWGGVAWLDEPADAASE